MGYTEGKKRTESDVFFMAETKQKYPVKSQKYKGVYQRKNGTWYYRIKRKSEEGTIDYYQASKFQTEEDAHKARISRLRDIAYREGMPVEEEQLRSGSFKTDEYIETQSCGACEYELKTFHDVFQDFLKDYVESDASKKKYQAMYNAQLYVWADKEIHSFEDTDIDLLLLKLSVKGYKASYIASIRKLIKKVFYYANLIDYTVRGDLCVGIDTKPYKLRLLSLFSGIGAPEQALKNLGVPYELVHFCEIDDKAAKAYCLLHSETEEERKNLEKKRIKDINDLAAGLIDYKWKNEESVWKSFGLEPPKHDCDGSVSDFDIMIFGFPCTDISSAGHQKGLKDEEGDLTRSGLFFKAMRIAYHKRPKLMIAENVAALVSKKHRKDFERILEEFEDVGYKYYIHKLNSKHFGLPQNRNRVFMILVRDDLNLKYEFPKGKPLEIRAEDWFEETVDDEYYATPSQLELIKTTKSRKANFNRDCISCITTGWGTTSYTQQTFVVDDKGTRCLSSQELMKFQGFTAEQGTMLRNNKFSKNQVGKLVGNSIAVPVMEAILEQLFDAL